MTSESPPADSMGRTMLYLSAILILGMLTYYFDGVLDKQHNPNTTLTGQTTAEGTVEVVLQRNRMGHYVATGKINQVSVIFMLDTGATDVAIPGSLASKLNLEKGLPGRAQTANGNVTTFHTKLDSLSLGDIHFRDISASITPSMTGDEILLGMSVLKELEMIQRDKQLILRQRP